MGQDRETKKTTVPPLGALLDTLPRRGNRTLLQVWEESEPVEWSYKTLGETIIRLAGGLTGSIKRGDRVAIYAPVGPDWLIAALATLRAGAVLVPVDLQFQGETLIHVLEDSGAVRVFTDSSHKDTVKHANDSVEIISLDKSDNDIPHWETLVDKETASLPNLQGKDTAVLFYTSGTTGLPKGVPLSCANLEYQLKVIADAGLVTEQDRVLLPLPLHHVYPFVAGMLTPLLQGLTLILPGALTGRLLVQAMREGRATVVIGVPRLYEALYLGIERQVKGGGKIAAIAFHGALGLSRALIMHLNSPAGSYLLAPLRRRLGPELRLLASGGAPLNPQLALNLRALGWQVAEGYGLTETSPLLAINTPGGPTGSVGLPVPGTEIRIQRQGLEEGIKDRSQGEIQARGPGVFRGYHNLEKETRQAFDGEWYRTGDLGYRDDNGYVYITGRLSTMLVTEGGENIQPDTLEERYARHPAIEEIGILQHQGKLVGLVVPADPSQDREEDLRRAVSEISRQLPSYQRLSDCRISRGKLPRTHLGKIQRHILQEEYEQTLAGENGASRGEPLPEDEMSSEDRALLDHPSASNVWQCLAERYPHTGLSPDSNLQLGLKIDSLEWVNLTLEIGQRTGVDLDESAIQELETVRDLLRVVSESGDKRDFEGSAPLEHPEQVLTEEQKRWLEPRRTWQVAAARCLHGLNRLVMKAIFRVKAAGKETLPDINFVLVANHASYLDAFALAAGLPFDRFRTLYWSGWTGVAFRSRPRRFFARLLQIIPIDPRHAARSSLAMGAAVLQQHNGLMWFPEGRRSASGEMAAFRTGIGLLLGQYPAMVVPAAIIGSYRAWPLHRRLPRPGRIAIRFGEPVASGDLVSEGRGNNDAEKIADALRARVEKLLR